MSNDIEIVVRGRNTSGQVFGQVNRSVTQATKNATAAWKEFDVLAVAAETAAHEIGILQDAIDRLSTGQPHAVAQGVGEIRNEARSGVIAVDQLTESTRQLASAAPAAQAASEQVDDIGDSARRAKEKVEDLDDKIDGLGKVRGSGVGGFLRELMSGLGDADIGSRLNTSITKGLSELPGVFGTVFGATGPVGIAIAAGLAATFGMAVATATAGVGLGAAAAGAIVLGIVGAAQDNRVKLAGLTLKESLTAELKDIGAPFVTSLLGAMRTVKDTVGTLGLRQMLAPLAGLLNPIVDGLFAMARAALPGVQRMIQATVPFVLQLVSDMPKLGEFIGEFADSLAGAGPGAAKFFHQLIMVVGSVLVAFGKLIEGAAKVMDFIGTVGEKLGLYDFGKSKFVDLSDSALGAGRSIGATSSAFDALFGTTTAVAEPLKTITESLTALNGMAVAAVNADLGWQTALDAATSSLQQHGATLDMNTESGRANMQALLGLASAASTRAQATYDDTFSTIGATEAERRASDAYEAGRQALIASAQQMGMSAQQARNLADRIMAVPTSWHTKVSVDTSWAEAAIARVRAAIASLSSPLVGGSGNAGTYAEYYYNQHRTGGVVSAAATGGARHGLTWVGEDGPELARLPNGTSIYPAGQSRQMAARAAGSTVFAPTFNITALDPQAAANAVLDALDAWVQANGPLPSWMVSAA